MKPGIYSDISNEDYHRGPGISKSGLDLINRSPMHYKAVIDAANDNEPTDAQALGTAAHAIILEPAEFAKNYCLGLRQQDVQHAIDDREQLVAMVEKLNEGRLPKLATGGNKGEQVDRILEHVGGNRDGLEKLKGAELKAILEEANAKRDGLLPTSGSRHDMAELLRANGVEVTLWSDVQAEWMKNNGHRTVLTAEQWDQLHRMRDAVMAHPAANALLTSAPGKAEQSVYWVDAETGVLCRCRPDYWREDGVLVDLKTTDDASPEGFAKSIANWRYDVQAPFYMDGVKAVTGRDALAFVFIAVEKKPPCAVGVYVLDSDSIQLGRAQYRADLHTFAACQATGNWPGYGDKIQTISVPGWHLNKNARLLEAQ